MIFVKSMSPSSGSDVMSMVSSGCSGTRLSNGSSDCLLSSSDDDDDDDDDELLDLSSSLEFAYFCL